MRVFKIGLVIGALVMWSATLAPMMVSAQFAEAQDRASTGGSVAVGQQMLHKDDDGKVALVQSAPPSGGVIQLAAFGWLEPYVDSAVQALIAAGFAWFGKSAYGKMMDEAARSALEAFLKNRASSLLADGAVRMEGKTVQVDSRALAAAADKANSLIPGALKRFGITPQLVAEKIVDAIPQTAAGAQIVANAHEETTVLATADKKGLVEPPTSAS